MFLQIIHESFKLIHFQTSKNKVNVYGYWMPSKCQNIPQQSSEPITQTIQSEYIFLCFFLGFLRGNWRILFSLLKCEHIGGPVFSYSCSFWQNLTEKIGWRPFPLWGCAPPPQGNPGSATGIACVGFVFMIPLHGTESREREQWNMTL